VLIDWYILDENPKDIEEELKRIIHFFSLVFLMLLKQLEFYDLRY